MPNYYGPCLDGCGRLARRRSGLSDVCYRRLRHRRNQFMHATLVVTGEAYPLDWLLPALRLDSGSPPFRRALEVVLALLEALNDGRLALYGHGGRARRRRRRSAGADEAGAVERGRV
jgi:hypothetical protein